MTHWRDASGDQRVTLIASKTLDSVAYIDTVHVLLKHGINARQLAQLKVLCDQERAAVSFYGKWKPRNVNPRYERELHLQTPTNTVYAHLARNINQTYCVNRVDVSLDLITRNKQDAYEVQDFLQLHLCKRRPGKNMTTEYATTLYWSKPQTKLDRYGRIKMIRPRRDIAAYSSLPSKITGQPCAHIDFRYFEAASCKRRFRTFADLQMLNLTDFWAEHLWLRENDPIKLERQVVRLGGINHAARIRKHRAKALGKFIPLKVTPDDTLRWYKGRLASILGTEYITIHPNALHLAAAQELRRFNM